MMDNLGYFPPFGHNYCKITKGALIVEKGESYGTIYHLCNDIVSNCETVAKLGNASIAVMLWH